MENPDNQKVNIFPERLPPAVAPIPSVLIKGVTVDGRKFRPSDWAQRLAAGATVNCDYCGITAHTRFNPYVKVVISEGVPCMWVSAALAEIDPPLRDFLLRFGEQNELVMANV